MLENGLLSLSQRHLNKKKDIPLGKINERQLGGDRVSKTTICENAKTLWRADDEILQGRLWKMKNCLRPAKTGLKSSRRGAASIALDEEGYLAQQVIKYDEPGMFWKKMSKRMIITVEGTRMPGHKAMKHRLTLLFCANASMDLKIKP